MGFFSKARDMYSLQKQTKSIKKELKNTHIEAEEGGVTVIINGEQEIISVSIADSAWQKFAAETHGKTQIQDAFKNALNKALKKVQEISGAKMKGVWETLGVAQK